jgi:hypothetical protein
MTINNNCDQYDQEFPGSQAEAHSRIALEQSALCAARLAIARWLNSSADACAPIAAPAPALARAAWFAQAQQDFQQWLGCGGFAQYEVAPSEDSEPPFGLRLVADNTRPGTVILRADTCID